MQRLDEMTLQVNPLQSHKGTAANEKKYKNKEIKYIDD
jgi:hypothetical protein